MSALSLAETTAWVTGPFERHGCSTENAQSVSRALVTAEADGLKGHGLSRLPTYLQMLRGGKIDGKAEPSAMRPRPAVLAIDAACGFAYPAIDLAISELPELASEQGIAVASIHRSNHCGAAGQPCEALAQHGLIALLFANTPSAMAPWGGRQPVFGAKSHRVCSSARRPPSRCGGSCALEGGARPDRCRQAARRNDSGRLGARY
jgi:(2R)-3-sulfolactate dehydrogenase (NADP+)